MIWVPAQLVGAYHGDTVTLTCFVEAHPVSLNYWEKDGVMIHAGEHYEYNQERGSPAYKVVYRDLLAPTSLTSANKQQAPGEIVT